MQNKFISYYLWILELVWHSWGYTVKFRGWGDGGKRERTPVNAHVGMGFCFYWEQEQGPRIL